MLSTIRTITFDLDGTLLDTVPDIAVAANAMLRELRQPTCTEQVIASFVGHGTAQLVAHCLPEMDAEDLVQAQGIFRRHYDHENGRRSQPYPGVMQALKMLNDAGLPLAVVTNKPAAFTDPLLASTGLAPFFRFAVSGDSLAEKKQHPLPLLHACQRFGVTPTENLHIGDSRHDAAAARAAGCPVWLTPYGYNAGEPVRAADCDAIVATLTEAAQHVLAANAAVSSSGRAFFPRPPCSAVASSAPSDGYRCA
jgi:phosphoglycolate phosphatase